MQSKNQKVKNVAATSFNKTRILNNFPDEIHRGFRELPVEPRGFLRCLGTPQNPSLLKGLMIGKHYYKNGPLVKNGNKINIKYVNFGKKI